MAAGKPICDRKQLVQVLDKLPESAVQEIMDFAEFIFAKRIKRKKVIQKKMHAKDPILKLIGMADVEPFADTVEHELYG